MKRLAIVILLLLPAGLLAYLRLQPEADVVYQNPLFHFYIVTFTTFASVVISILLTSALGDAVQARHLLAATAFGIMGSVFFSHGAATPNALINYFHPAVQWSAWITLLFSGAIFALAGIIQDAGQPSWLSVRKIVSFFTALVIIYLGVAIFAHRILDAIGSQAAPWHKLTIFYMTLAVWGFASVRMGWIWRKTQSRVDGALAFVSFWLFFATISMHTNENGRLSWWLYHFLMLVSFLITVFVLVREYEQTRKFQLTRYYVAASLILMAFLALLASYVFANYSYEEMVSQTKDEAQTGILTLTNAIQQSLPADVSDTTALNTYANRMVDQPIGEKLLIIGKNGFYFYPPDDYDEPKLVNDASLPAFEQALAGEIVLNIALPGQSADIYTPSEDYHTLTVFAPLYRAGTPEPLGVAQIVRSLPDLTNAILSARVTGLAVTAATMGLLFFALLLVIRRADHILTLRSRELEKAYSELKRAEMLRDDMTNMIVHDLRNPITAISTSLEFIEKTAPTSAPSLRFTDIAKNASQKMIRLVDDILTVSKFESGELKIRKERVAIAPLIAKSLEGFRSQSEVEQKQLGYYCPPELQLTIDPVLISRVLDNLISNAFKYTDDQAGLIEVFVQAQNGRANFHVRDNGEGVPDAYKTIVFDKFKQVPNNGSERKGTGLGLTFCRMVVEAHGGKISVRDAEGGGSEFVFWISAGEEGG
ncbi:MAG TPA: HAMP domain-containing sensor histidine kinase [Anaerolineales bacterium]|nr:HAMP domain-containing sensor histidine kinase [Anaerolineales bacterium]